MITPVAVITGASRGLGLALTRRFLEAGWRVHGISRHGMSSHASFPHDVKRESEFLMHKLDLTSVAQVRRFVQTIHKKEKQIGLLINNAGYSGKLLRTEEIPLAEYRKILDGNLLSTFLMYSVLPGMREYIQKKDWGNVKKLYGKTTKFLAACGVILVLIGSFAGPFLIEILTHKKYVLPEYWFVLPMMLLLAAVSYGYDLVLVTLFALEEDMWILKLEVVSLIAACAVFSLSLLEMSLVWKIFIIIAGAIVGETVITVAGLYKAGKILRLQKS